MTTPSTQAGDADAGAEGSGRPPEPRSGPPRGSRARVEAPSSRGFTAAVLLVASLVAAAGCDGWWSSLISRELDASSGNEIPVIFLTGGSGDQLPAEESAALRWLRRHDDFQVRTLSFLDLPDSRLPADGVLWWHESRDVGLPSAAVDGAALETVRDHVAAGGGLLLTLLAAPYAVPLGLETVPPNRVEISAPGSLPLYRGDRPFYGLQSRGRHGLLRRFWGGADTAVLRPDRRYPVALYDGGAYPEQGRAWAVLRGASGADPGLVAGVQYPPERAGRRGAVVTIGAACYFADAEDPNRRRLQLLVGDALRHLGGQRPPPPPGARRAAPSSTPASNGDAAAPASPEEPHPSSSGSAPDSGGRWQAWEPPSARTILYRPSIGVTANPASDGRSLEAVEAARSGLRLSRDEVGDAPFDLSGPRSLCSGRQRGRIDELWAYPVRLLRELRFGIVDPDGVVTWIDDGPGDRTFTARPEGASLVYVDDGLRVELHLAVPRNVPALVALLDVDTARPVQLVATWTADHAALWHGATGRSGDLFLGWDDRAHAVVWRDRGGRITGIGGFGRPVAGTALGFEPGSVDAAADPLSPSPHLELEPGAELPRSTVALRVPLAADGDVAVPFVVVGGIRGLPALRDAYARLLREPASAWVANAAHYRELLTTTLDVQTPDPTFDEAFRWAKVGIDSLRTTIPGLGVGLIAGYGARPRHAPADRSDGTAPESWLGGLDSLWTASAADAYGDPGLADDLLRQAARFRDVEGRIPDSLAPAGTLRHDVVDPTPLFLIALEHHLRTTGDTDSFRSLWPAAREAARLCLRAVEDGEAAVDPAITTRWLDLGDDERPPQTLHLASLLAAGLRAAADLAERAGDAEFSRRCRQAADPLASTLDDRLWDREGRYYHYGIRGDGRPVRHRTLLPALALRHRLLDAGRAVSLLDLFPSDELTTDWGARLLARSSPHYRPDLQGAGAVSPIYSGWAALAEYAYHRPLSGFAHLTSTLGLARQRNLGFIGDAWHGRRFVPLAGTSHRAAAEALGLLPAIEGLLGLRVDALAETLTFIPHLPGGWNHIVASPVRIGGDSYRLAVTRSDEATEFVVERLGGTGPTRFVLGVPVPREVPVSVDRDASSGIVVREEEVVSSTFDHAAVATVLLTESRARIVFRHGAFPAVVPAPRTPEPGARSAGLRWIESRYRLGALVVRLAGRPGTPYRLAIDTPWRIAAVSGVPGARILRPGPGRAAVELALRGPAEAYQQVELRLEFDR